MTKAELKKLMMRYIIVDIDLEYIFDFCEALLLKLARETEKNEPYAVNTIERYEEAARTMYELYEYVNGIMEGED